MAPAAGQLSLFEVEALDRPTSAPEVSSTKVQSTNGHPTVRPHRGRDSASRLPTSAPAASSAATSLLSPEDVARRCGVSRKAVYRAVARGELRAARILSRLRIDPPDVEDWIRANIVEVGCVDGPRRSGGRSRSPVSTGLR